MLAATAHAQERKRMGRIQSSVGLITGIPIEETVEQLLSISAQPRDRLITRNEGLQAERVAITELTALVIGVQFSVESLGSGNLFDQKQVRSSNEELLNVATTGSPAAGVYDFTPIRQAQTHQLLSSGIAANDEPLGAGEVTVQFGGFVDKGISLDELNAGEGVERGRIQITDRSGASAEIDLRFAQTIDEVLQAINEENSIDVTASVNGDRLTLVDTSGQSTSNLRVREVGSGTTAADLGLANVNVADDNAVGEDILSLHEDLSLDLLNDGNGVYFRSGVADLEVTFSDGSNPLRIEFLAEAKGPTASTATVEGKNGSDTSFTITSLGTGEEWDGYDVIFEDNDDISVGDETVAVDTVSKEIRFQIDAGATRAVHLVAAINDDETASGLFSAEVINGDGHGIIDTADRATSKGGAIEYAEENTIGDVLKTINAADPTRLRAEINADGDGINIVDLTYDPNAPAAPTGPNLWNVGQPINGGPNGNGTTAVGPNLWNTGQPIPNSTTARGFTIKSLFGGTAAEDLGLTNESADGVVQSRRRLSGLDTVLLDTLGGGSGLGELGVIDITDRSGNSASVDLSNAETLEEVLRSINDAGLGVRAAVNSARNGIALVDTTGGSENLIVANGDGTNTADSLKIAVDEATSEVNSGSLNLRTFHAGLTLDSLNQGEGVGSGSFLITDSDGKIAAVNTSIGDINTVGDLISEINRQASQVGVGVRASINDTGDGLQLIDTARGTGRLRVQDVGSGAVAAGLNIAGTSESALINGEEIEVIDGSSAVRIQLDDDDTLEDLVSKLNAADANIAASVFNNGSLSKPYRLSIVSQLSGSAGELLIDTSSLGIEFDELVEAKDALLALGPADSSITPALVSSSTNEFDSVIEGITLTALGASNETVTINVDQTEDPIVSQINLFVEQYNNLRDKVDELTFYDEIEQSSGLLFGRSETLRIEFDLGNVITGRYFGAGPIQSLEEVGLGLNTSGKLVFDEEKFRSKYEAAPNAVERFFTAEETGVAARLVKVAEQLAGEDNSVLVSRTQALQETMELNSNRILALTGALERERESLLEEFFRLETAIGQMQNSLQAVSQIQPVQPLVSVGAGA